MARRRGGAKARGGSARTSSAATATAGTDRMRERARLYRWLSADLVDWQDANPGGSVSAEDCPVVVQIHNEACRRLYMGQLTAEEAAKAATDILVSNTRGVKYDDPIYGAFTFMAEEIVPLTTLMLDVQFFPLAPYTPLGQLLMW